MRERQNGERGRRSEVRFEIAPITGSPASAFALSGSMARLGAGKLGQALDR
jgi:hypothetical protein